MGASASNIVAATKANLREHILNGKLSTVEILDNQEYRTIIDVLVKSFTAPPADPMFSWMVEDDKISEGEYDRRLLLQTSFMMEWVNRPLIHKGILLGVKDKSEIVGAASLLPPGVLHFPIWTSAYQVVSIGMPPSMMYKSEWGPIPQKKLDAYGAVEVAKKAVPKEFGPSWYLQAIGVLKTHHGKGLGGALLRSVCALADHTQHPVYLDTESEWHEELYKHFGFETFRKLELRVEGEDSVRVQPIYIMVRKPQQANAQRAARSG